MQDNKKGKLLKNHTRDIRRDTMGGAGQAEAGLVGRWLAKKSKQNASASRQMADKLVRLSPKSLLTMFKKTSLQPLPLNSAVLTSSLCLDVFQIDICLLLYVVRLAGWLKHCVSLSLADLALIIKSVNLRLNANPVSS